MSMRNKLGTRPPKSHWINKAHDTASNQDTCLLWSAFAEVTPNELQFKKETPGGHLRLRTTCDICSQSSVRGIRAKTCAEVKPEAIHGKSSKDPSHTPAEDPRKPTILFAVSMMRLAESKTGNAAGTRFFATIIPTFMSLPASSINRQTELNSEFTLPQDGGRCFGN